MNKKYDPKFKQEAVNLALNSEQTYRQTANNLGINYKTFCNWIYQTIKLNKKPDYQELELRKKEIEILKKAT